MTELSRRQFMVGVAPAISNAVARFTGARLRETPMTPERVKKALG